MARLRVPFRRADPRARYLPREQRRSGLQEGAAALGRRLRRFLAWLDAWVGPFFLLSGKSLSYLVVIISVSSCNFCPGGALIGGLIALLGSIVAGIITFRFRVQAFAYLATGIALAAFPSAYMGSAMVLVNQYQRATVVERDFNADGGVGPDVLQELQEAEVMVLKNAKPQFSFLAEAYEETPLPISRHVRRDGYHAGKAEAGTFCLLPLTPSAWVPEQEIPVLVLCDNDWSGRADCGRAHRGDFDSQSSYQYEELHRCFQRVEKYHGDGLDGEEWVWKHGNSMYARRVGFAEFESKLTFAQKALPALRAAGVKASEDTPIVYLEESPCCVQRSAREIQVTVALVFVFSLPVIVYMLKTVFWKHLRKIQRQFLPTRDVLLTKIRSVF